SRRVTGDRRSPALKFPCVYVLPILKNSLRPHFSEAAWAVLIQSASFIFHVEWLVFLRVITITRNCPAAFQGIKKFHHWVPSLTRCMVEEHLERCRMYC